MHPTQNDLPQKTRVKVIGVLGDRLADATDLMLQSKQAHWNVKGPSFIALHEQLTSTHVYPQWLGELESRDNLFPEINYRYWE